MKFEWKSYKTALHIAVEKENIEIIRLLLSREDIDVNILLILNLKFLNIILNYVLNSISNRFILMTFKIVFD